MRAPSSQPAWLRAFGPPSGLAEPVRSLPLPPCAIDIVEELIDRIAVGGPPYGRGLILYGDRGLAQRLARAATHAVAQLPVPVTSPGKPHSHPPCYTDFKSLMRLDRAADPGAGHDPAACSIRRGLWSSPGEPSARLLVIEGLGEEQAGRSRRSELLLHHILRSRYDASAPTIVIPRFPYAAWAQYGSATASFVREAFTVMEISAPG